MNKRYKLIILLFISFLMAIIIYFVFRKKEINYLFIGDNMSFNVSYDFNDYYIHDNKNIYYKKYLDNYLIIDEEINKLTSNEGNINYYIRNADILVISLGTSELNNYQNINEEITLNYLKDVYNLLLRVRKINKKKIVFINMYDEKYELLNKKLREYSDSFNILYIDINDVNSVFISNNRTMLPNESQEIVYKLIKEYVNK